MANNGDIIQFVRTKDYQMINNALGEGSFGKTVLLLDPFINEFFVAKKYEPESVEIKEKFYNNFLDEIKILYKLSHRNIVRVFNYYAYSSVYTGIIIMEYISGENIEEYFNRFVPFENKISPNDVFRQLIEGFQHIEEAGIIHRDIRESNILISDLGIVKIIDFGLGKTFDPVQITDDSLVEIVNRSGLDALPNEYFDGTYDSQTDMFYLAELFNRVLRKTGNAFSFSYQPILDKMMSQDKTSRYKSFNAIKEVIGKKDLSILDISGKDKNIYLGFSDAIKDNIIVFTSKKKFITDIEVFKKNIENILERNCFEYNLQSISELIKTVVSCGCRYRNHVPIEMGLIKNFYDWYILLIKESQKLVLNNIIYKLSYVEEEQKEDIPF